MEFFSVRLSDRPGCYCPVLTRLGQYEVSAVFFVTVLPLLMYYSGFVLNSFSESMTLLSSNELVE